MADFHPKAVILSLHALLFISSLSMAAFILPVTSIFLGEFTEFLIIGGVVPLLIGFILSNFLRGENLVKNGVIGSAILGFTAGTGVIVNKILQNSMIEISRQMEEVFRSTNNQTLPTDSTQVSGILGNVEAIGVDTTALFLITFLAFNTPLLYNYFQNNKSQKTYLLWYIAPLILYTAIYFVLKA